MVYYFKKMNSSPLLQSSAILLLCVVLFMIGPISIYETNDDVCYSLILSGKLLTSEPNAHVVFINIILSYIFTKLYLVFPNYQWFGLFQVASLLLSVFYLNYIYSLINNNAKFAIRLIISVICTLPFLFLIQFTKTSFVLATAGYLCLFMLNKNKNSPLAHNLYLHLISLCFLVLSFSLRKESFFLVTALCFALMVRAVCNKSKVLNAVLVAGAIIIITFSFIHRLSYDQTWQDYFSTQKTLSSIIDYDRIKYDYGVFSKAGLSLNDYFMIKIWGYSDNTIFNKERLEFIFNNSVHQTLYKNYASTFQDAIAFPALNYILAALILAVAVLLLYQHQNGLLCIYVVIPLFVCITLLLIQGRFPARISTPLAFFLLWGIIIFSDNLRKNPLVLFISASMMALSFFSIYKHMIDISVIVNKITLQKNSELHKFGAMATRKPITLVTLGEAFPFEGILPFESPSYLSNIRFIWLCGMNQSPIQRKQLSECGIQNLFESLITTDNIYMTVHPMLTKIVKRYIYEHNQANVTFLPSHIYSTFTTYQIRQISRQAIN